MCYHIVTLRMQINPIVADYVCPKALTAINDHPLKGRFRPRLSERQTTAGDCSHSLFLIYTQFLINLHLLCPNTFTLSFTPYNTLTYYMVQHLVTGDPVHHNMTRHLPSSTLDKQCCPARRTLHTTNPTLYRS